MNDALGIMQIDCLTGISGMICSPSLFRLETYGYEGWRREEGEIATWNVERIFHRERVFKARIKRIERIKRIDFSSE